MKRKTYKATIINNGRVITMLVGGYNKPSVKKELTDFFIKTKQMEDYRKFEIYLKQVLADLGKITGDDISEDIINEIFSKFCLGK